MFRINYGDSRTPTDSSLVPPRRLFSFLRISMKTSSVNTNVERRICAERNLSRFNSKKVTATRDNTENILRTAPRCLSVRTNRRVKEKVQLDDNNRNERTTRLETKSPRRESNQTAVVTLAESASNQPFALVC